MVSLGSRCHPRQMKAPLTDSVAIKHGLPGGLPLGGFIYRCVSRRVCVVFVGLNQLARVLASTVAALLLSYPRLAACFSF